MRCLGILAVCLCGTGILACGGAAAPSVVVWAWERPEDLRSLPATAGVAFLARTIEVRGAGVSDRPRLQPLRFAPGAPLIAVVRIESQLPHMSALAPVVALLARSAATPGIVALQIDYDATASERTFYAALLRDLRPRMPAAVRLSITALASWCLDDRWLSGLPVDEAVPMLFRMGQDAARVRAHLAGGGDFAEPLCRTSLGVSTDEPLVSPSRGRRVYLFHPRAWTPHAARATLEFSR